MHKIKNSIRNRQQNRSYSLNQFRTLQIHGNLTLKKDNLQNQLFNHHLVQTNKHIQSLLKKLHTLFIHYKVAQFYPFFLYSHLIRANEQQIETVITDQIQKLKERISHYQLIQQSIEARQACLIRLGRHLQNLFNNSSEQHAYHLFSTQVINYRKLTSYSVERIQIWKNGLLEISSQQEHISYIYKGQDYLIKLLNDTQFITSSYLSSHVKFSQKNDPFLLKPTLQFVQNQYSLMFKITGGEREQYLQRLDYLAAQRISYLKKKLQSKEQKMKEIQKIYHNTLLIPKINKIKLNNDEKLKANHKLHQAQEQIKQIDFVQVQQKIGKLKQVNEKIKKIKSTFSSTSSIQNPNKLLILPRKGTPQKLQKLKHRIKLHPTPQDQLFLDFQKLARKKQIEIIKQDMKKSQRIKPMKINDTLTYEPFLGNQEKIQRLKMVEQNLEINTPYHLKDYIIHGKQLKVNQFQKDQNRNNQVMKASNNILQHNQQVIQILRKQVIHEIEKGKTQQEQLLQTKKRQHQTMKVLLLEKKNQKILNHIQEHKQQNISGRSILAKQMGKKELFGYNRNNQSMNSQKLTQLQKQLKKQMQLKWLREVQAELKKETQLAQIQKQKQKQSRQIQKQMQKIREKQQMEHNYQQIQKMQKGKIVRQQIELDQKRKTEIQTQIYNIIKKQKQHFQQLSNQKQSQLEIQMKNNIKSSILQHLKEQKQIYYDEKSKQQHMRKKQNQFREEVRRKLENQYEVEEMIKKHQRHQEINYKLKTIFQGEQTNVKTISPKQNIIQENYQTAKSKMTYLYPKSSMQEKSKQKLREQFQCELLGYKKKIKSQKQSNLQEFIDNRMKELAAEQEQIEKIKIEENQSKIKLLEEKKSQDSEKFVAYSDKIDKLEDSEEEEKIIVITEQEEQKQAENKEDQKNRIKLKMSYQEYKIYKKKKQVIYNMRDQENQKEKKEQIEKNKLKKIVQQFQIMPITEEPKHQEMQSSQNNNSKINQIKRLSQGEERQQVVSIIQNYLMQDKLISMEQIDQSQENRVKKKEIQKRFFTSGSESEEELYQKRQKLRKRKKSQFNPQKLKLSEVPVSIQQVKEQIQIQKKSFVKKRQISQINFTQFLNTHMEGIPKIIRKVNSVKKQQIASFLLSKQAYNIFEYIKGGYSIGQVICCCNYKTKNRSLNFIHLGSYDQVDLLQLLLNCARYVFTHDPCDQVTVSFLYDKANNQQLDFINSFFKKFDPHGAVLQKKINNQQFQRKHILKRMIGEVFQKQLQNNNLGSLQISTEIIVTSNSISNKINKINENMGYFCLLAYYLSGHFDKKIFNKIISDDEVPSKNAIKYIYQLYRGIINNNPILDQFNEHEFDNILQLNQELVKNQQETLKCSPDKLEQNTICHRTQMNLKLQLACSFILSRNNFKIQDDYYSARYFRFQPTKNNKTFVLKSSVFNTEVTVLTCKNSKYKYLLLSAIQFDQLKEKITLDIYLKLLLTNLQKHSLGNWQYIWIPQFKIKGKCEIQEMAVFQKYIQYRQSINFTHINYLGNSLKVQPSHRDLFVSPPFIFAILNSQIQKYIQGSPILSHRVQLSHLIDVEEQSIPIDKMD